MLLSECSFAVTDSTHMASASQPEPSVLALEGEIDLHESPRIKEKLEPLIARALPRLVVDLSDVTYIDSSGLALFIETLQRMQSKGGQLVLCGLGPSVRAIFEIARLDQVFKIYADRATALAA